MKAGWLVCLVVVWATAAQAHKPSDSYLTLQADGTSIAGRWDIALRDLDDAIGIDANGDGAITWGEVRARHEAIAAYAAAHLELVGDGQGCTLRPSDQLVAVHTDGAYAVLRFAVVCSTRPRALAIHYRLFFERDPQHRGLLRVTGGGAEQLRIFTREQTLQTVDVGPPGIVFRMGAAWWDGLLCGWTMPHHLLIATALLALLVPLRRRSRRDGSSTSRPAAVKALLVFAVAQAIALSVAALQIVHLQPRAIEYGIAAFVAAVALVGVYRGRAMSWLACGLGLLDGMVLAPALATAGASTPPPMLTILAFNAGVDGALLLVIAALDPALSYLRLARSDRARARSAGARLATVLLRRAS